MINIRTSLITSPDLSAATSRGVAAERPPTRTEIQDRISQRYIERLSLRSKRMRRALLERDWSDLHQECSQIADTAKEFGFDEIAQVARTAESALRPGLTLNRRIFGALRGASFQPPQGDAKAAIDALLKSIDTLLVARA
jgi:HPt (histidine-containing phosphotransfer) domain-containing protein